jgi:predicted phage terminase large subunit-like protein
MTTRRGGRFATSVGGTLTGRGGSIIIIDDAMKAEDALSDVMRKRVIQWFSDTLITRLDDKRNDVIIVVQQRLHVDDLVGHLLATGEWVHLNLAVIAQQDEHVLIGPNRRYLRRQGELLHPAREDEAELAELERALGPRAFAAQYLQAPVPPDGTIIHWSWFRRYDEMPSRRPDDEVIQSWDTAVKAGLTNDYSVCTTWLVRDKTYYLLDVFRARLEFPALRRKIIQHADAWRVDTILIEDSASGASLLQELKQRPDGATWSVEAVQPVGDKVQRAEAQAVPIEAGQVLLPSQAPWLEALYAEIRDFPRGHDDQVDSITQFLAWVRTRVKWARHIKVTWPRSG